MRETTGAAGPEPGDEIRAGAGLLFDAVDGIVGIAQGMHRAFSPFRRLSGIDRTGGVDRTSGDTAGATPSFADLAFGTVRAATAVAAVVTDVALDVSGIGTRVRPLRDTGWGRRLGAVLNGAIGDRLAGDYPALATPLRLRVTGTDVHPDTDRLAEHYPHATGHVVVLLHGLVHDEANWRRFDREGSPLPDFGERLAADLGATAVYVRYNSGRHISDNGRELADLLTGLVTSWPVRVDRISLVGHSMGGLVARSAVHQAVAREQPWLAPLRDVVCLGSPHRGSGVERGADVTARLVGRFDRSAPLATLFTHRSAGIKDLRQGSLDESDWSDPDGTVRRTRYEVAPHVRQYFLAATLARDPAGLRGRLVGDLLVSPASATDAGQAARRYAIGGIGHTELMRHPRVYAQVRRWLQQSGED
jgi:triacylglycerol lipase